MLSSVFSKTLRDLRGQILGWGAGLAAMSAGMVLSYPSMQDMPDVEAFIEMLPSFAQQIIGDPSTLKVLENFLDLKLFDSALPILLSVFAIIVGAAAIAGEEERGTIDLLMANPIKRWRVVVEKFAAMMIALVAMCCFISLGMAVAIKTLALEASIRHIVWATFNVLPVVAIFGAIATFGSCLFRRSRHAAAIAVSLLVSSYFIYTIGPISPSMQPWLKLSLFHYYAKTKPFRGESDFMMVCALVSVAILLVVAAVAAFRRKDLAV